MRILETLRRRHREADRPAGCPRPKAPAPTVRRDDPPPAPSTPAPPPARQDDLRVSTAGRPRTDEAGADLGMPSEPARPAASRPFATDSESTPLQSIADEPRIATNEPISPDPRIATNEPISPDPRIATNEPNAADHVASRSLLSPLALLLALVLPMVVTTQAAGALTNEPSPAARGHIPILKGIPCPAWQPGGAFLLVPGAGSEIATRRRYAVDCEGPEPRPGFPSPDRARTDGTDAGGVGRENGSTWWVGMANAFGDGLGR